MPLINPVSAIQPAKQRPRWRISPQITAGALLALPLIAALGMLGWPWHIRFMFAPLNPLFVGLSACTIPAALFVAATAVHRIWLRRTMQVFGFLTVLPAAAVALSSAVLAADSMPQNGRGGMFTQLAELPAGAASLRLYLSDCGATCAYGLVLQEEIDTPFGLQLYRSVWSKYRTDDKATLQRLDANTVMVVESNGNTSRVPN